MSAERNALRSIEPEIDRRAEPSKSPAFQASALSAALGLAVGIIVELALPGQGPRIGLSVVGLVGGGFVSVWAARALVTGVA
jgi:hypothetical protein